MHGCIFVERNWNFLGVNMVVFHEPRMTHVLSWDMNIAELQALWGCSCCVSEGPTSADSSPIMVVATEDEFPSVKDMERYQGKSSTLDVNIFAWRGKFWICKVGLFLIVQKIPLSTKRASISLRALFNGRQVKKKSWPKKHLLCGV